MRSNQEDTSAFNTFFQSGKFSHSRRVLTGNVVLTTNGSLVNFLDPSGATRDCTLPPLEEGRFYVVSNVGAGTVNVRSANGFLITSLTSGDTALLFASDAEWVALRGWAALGVFTNTVNGLVPAPNSLVPGSLFLRDDGQWGQVQVTGIVDAFKFITDGTNTAIGSGPDTFRIRSSTGKIGAVVTNNEAVFGDNVNLTVNEGAVDHNALLNYVADQHVAHSGVTLTAGLGISGGGTIAASRTFDFAPSELSVNGAPVLTDYAVMDLAAGGPRTTLWSSINAILNHNNLLNYVADQHVAHTGVSIVAGTGLSGGGNIAASRTLALDINGLAADTPAILDSIAFFDVSGGDTNKTTFSVLNGILDHNSLLNYVANQHIDHTAVTITGTGNLTGGGTIAASRTLDMANMAAWSFKGNATAGSAAPTDVTLPGLTAKATAASADIVLIADSAASNAWKRTTVAGLQGAAAVASVNGQTGALTLPILPQGRLTLQTSVAVMTSTQSAKTTLYYTATGGPGAGNQIPIYDGTNLVSTTITGNEISVLTTDTTKSPAAIGASKVNDWFVWNDAGTIRLGHGPDWTNDTTRSAGTALVAVNGIWTNNVAITNGPAQFRGTYVGTTRSNASSQLDWILGASASGGTAAFLGVWNAYNRVDVGTTVTDSGATYTLTSATTRQARASAGNQISFILGLQEDSVHAAYFTEFTTVAAANAVPAIGLGFDTTTAFSRQRMLFIAPTANAYRLSLGHATQWSAGIGFHFLSANEQSDNVNANTFNSDSGAFLSATIRM